MDLLRRAPSTSAKVLRCALLLLAPACAHTHFDGSRFEKKGVAYRVGALAPAFTRVHVEDNDLSWQGGQLGTISVQATCSGYDDLPQAVLANHLLFGTTERVYRADDEITVDGRGARHLIVDCELDGVPVRAEIYVLTRRGCVFDLVYVSDRQARAHPQFTAFVQAFRVEAAP